jgi:hypothetical protein
MAASSSSNDSSSTTNNLTNNYFFYGTHPVKVPNSVPHSTSTNNIPSTSDRNTHYSSLHLTNTHHGYSSTSEIPITKSLNNFPQSHTNDDETSEVSIFLNTFIYAEKNTA